MFQLDLIHEVFDFYEFLYPVNRLLDIFYKNRTIVLGQVEAPLLNIKNAVAGFLKVSTGFNTQLKELSKAEGLPELSIVIQERFSKAINYFKTETETHLVSSLKMFGFTTDNKAVGSDITKSIDTIEELLQAKILYFNNLNEGFSTSKFLEKPFANGLYTVLLIKC